VPRRRLHCPRVFEGLSLCFNLTVLSQTPMSGPFFCFPPLFYQELSTIPLFWVVGGTGFLVFNQWVGPFFPRAFLRHIKITATRSFPSLCFGLGVVKSGFLFFRFTPEQLFHPYQHFPPLPCHDLYLFFIIVLIFFSLNVPPLPFFHIVFVFPLFFAS